ncbi:MAG: NAD(P)-dependent oxidoreductase, partial [Saprospiraceae bacterium]
RTKYWNREKNRGFELQGKTIGIIGFGHTGAAFASKLSGMGMKILVYDKYKSHYTFGHPFVKETTLEEIQNQADIISFHLPLTEEIHHYLNADFIIKCKKGFVLINTSRGKVVDTKALIQGLENGQIGGACLDVFENEKPNTFSQEEHEMYNQLYQFPNTILTPHVAGWTVESKARLSEVILGKLRKVL